MDAINLDILQQLQEYARVYFDAIVKCNTINGKCQLKAGVYSAKDMTDNSHKSVSGKAYELPDDTMFDESVELQSGTFKCRFPYRRIFLILNDWETMCKAGKLKTVFEIGEVEQKSVKVLTLEKTVLGVYKTKTMKLQRIGRNWWGSPKEIGKGNEITGYYELGGVMFNPGKQFIGDVYHESVQKFVNEWNDAKLSGALIGFIASRPEQRYAEYYKAVLDIAGIDTETEEARAIAEAAIEKRRVEDEKQAHELAERNAREEQARRERLEQEERMKREAAERLEKSKEKFIAGKMISRDEFEDIAESIGYEINIRTLGTLRKRITWIEVDGEGTPTVYGTKTRRGLDGTFAMIREVYARLKESMPEPVRHISEIMDENNLHGVGYEQTDERKYYDWLRDAYFGEYCTIADKALAEALTGIFLAAYRKGKGHITAMNKDGVLIETVITSIEPPQSPATPETANRTSERPKRATEPPKEPKHTIKVLLIYRHPERIMRIVPRSTDCSTAHHVRGTTKMAFAPPGYVPPIR